MRRYGYGPTCHATSRKVSLRRPLHAMRPCAIGSRYIYMTIIPGLPPPAGADCLCVYPSAGMRGHAFMNICRCDNGMAVLTAI
jgi:hypothetical protein